MLWSHVTNQTLETLTLHGRSLMPTKQSMCSSDNLPLLGSRCLEEHLKKKRCVNNSDFLPAFYHAEPTGLVVQPTHTAHPVAIIDLTPGSGYWAVESVRNKVPYIGFGHTTVHCDMLCSKLRSRASRRPWTPTTEISTTRSIPTSSRPSKIPGPHPRGRRPRPLLNEFDQIITE